MLRQEGGRGSIPPTLSSSCLSRSGARGTAVGSVSGCPGPRIAVCSDARSGCCRRSLTPPPLPPCRSRRPPRTRGQGPRGRARRGGGRSSSPKPRPTFRFLFVPRLFSPNFWTTVGIAERSVSACGLPPPAVRVPVLPRPHCARARFRADRALLRAEHGQLHVEPRAERAHSSVPQRRGGHRQQADCRSRIGPPRNRAPRHPSVTFSGHDPSIG